MSLTLPSTVDSLPTRKRIEKAAAAAFPRRRRELYYEHGQWWLTIAGDTHFSVVDAEGPGSFHGFAFKEIT